MVWWRTEYQAVKKKQAVIHLYADRLGRYIDDKKRYDIEGAELKVKYLEDHVWYLYHKMKSWTYLIHRFWTGMIH